MSPSQFHISCNLIALDMTTTQMLQNNSFVCAVGDLDLSIAFYPKIEVTGRLFQAAALSSHAAARASV